MAASLVRHLARTLLGAANRSGRSAAPLPHVALGRGEAVLERELPLALPGSVVMRLADAAARRPTDSPKRHQRTFLAMESLALSELPAKHAAMAHPGRVAGRPFPALRQRRRNRVVSLRNYAEK